MLCVMHCPKNWDEHDEHYPCSNEIFSEVGTDAKYMTTCSSLFGLYSHVNDKMLSMKKKKLSSRKEYKRGGGKGHRVPKWQVNKPKGRMGVSHVKIRSRCYGLSGLHIPKLLLDYSETRKRKNGKGITIYLTPTMSQVMDYMLLSDTLSFKVT